MTRVSRPQLAEVDELFRARVERGTAPSSVWGVFDRAGLVASGGHGDRGDGLAPDADTVYRIASCTKSVTAATLLALVADGHVRLDDPVTDFVPAFGRVPLPTPDSPVPTLRMLLTMAGGFPTDDPWADRQEPISDAELDAVLRDGLLFDSVPGTRFAYSNLGYALLGRVIAVVTGHLYTEVATDIVLRPLGLDATVFRAADATGFVVTGVRPARDGSGVGDWEALPTTGPGAFSSIGGLFSTVSDLARWGRHLASVFSDSPEPGPVSPADRRAMQQAMRVVPPETLPTTSRATAYGFGLFVEQDPQFGEIVSHSGGYPGFSAHMRWSVRDGIGLVAFENATRAAVAAGAAQALDLLLTAANEGAPGRTAVDARTSTGASASTSTSTSTSASTSTSTSPASTESGGTDRTDGRQPAPGTGRTADATRAAQAAVSRLLADWSDDLADAICTPNVAMDVPYERRRRSVAAAAEQVGADLGSAPGDVQSLAPSHLRWWLPGSAGRLRIEIRLAPLAEGRVQTLNVVAEPTEH